MLSPKTRKSSRTEMAFDLVCMECRFLNAVDKEKDRLV